MSRLVRHIALAAAARIAALSASAGAQLLGGRLLPPVGLPGCRSAQPAGRRAGAAEHSRPARRAAGDQPDARHGYRPHRERSPSPARRTLLELRRLRLQELIRTNRATVESDGNGSAGAPRDRRRARSRSGRPSARARRGLPHRWRRSRPGAWACASSRSSAPNGMSAKDGAQAAAKDRALSCRPTSTICSSLPAAALCADRRSARRGAAAVGGGRAIGMIDGGVASHPSLAGASIEQNGFAGAPQPTGHGTAVASLLVGSQGPFRGAATGARLLVADVYGGNRAAGSATSIVRALGWLVGPPPAGDQHQPRRAAEHAGPARNPDRRSRAASRWSQRSATTAPPLRRNIRPPIPA